MKSSPQTLVFYDGACPVCAHEMHVLKHHDHQGRLALIDIAAPDFDERAWPVSIAELNARMHVRRSDGAWLKGMAAIRHVYRAIGKGWLLAPTRWPLLVHVFDRAYLWFARNRMAVSARLGMRVCTGDTCRIFR